jgi:hypothetical protein
MKQWCRWAMMLAILASPSSGAAVPPPSSTPGDLALYSGQLYAVGAPHGVVRSAADVSKSSVIVSSDVTVTSIAAGPPGIAFTTWDGSHGKIMAAAHDGSHLREILTAQGSPDEIAFHGSDLVWLDREGGTVSKVTLSGGKATVLAHLDHPGQMAVDGDDAFVAVWSAGTVVRVPLRGGKVVVLASGQQGPQGVALHGNTVFFGSHFDHDVRSVPRVGGPVTVVAQQPDCAVEEVAADASHVYFTCFGGALMRASRKGGRPVELAPPDDGICALALGPGALFAYSAFRDRFQRFAR